jgi:hypothetical protein
MKMTGGPQRKQDISAVVIQVSGSMTAGGRREAMFDVATTFAPCDVFANDEGKIIYCGHIENTNSYQDAVMMPMTGMQDTIPTFHLIGFARDYKQVIFVDDGDVCILTLVECKEVIRALRIVKQTAPIKGVIVRDFERNPSAAKMNIHRAREVGVMCSFYNHSTPSRGYYLNTR